MQPVLVKALSRRVETTVRVLTATLGAEAALGFHDTVSGRLAKQLGALLRDVADAVRSSRAEHEENQSWLKGLVATRQPPPEWAHLGEDELRERIAARLRDTDHRLTGLFTGLSERVLAALEETDPGHCLRGRGSEGDMGRDLRQELDAVGIEVANADVASAQRGIGRLGERLSEHRVRLADLATEDATPAVERARGGSDAAAASRKVMDRVRADMSEALDLWRAVLTAATRSEELVLAVGRATADQLQAVHDDFDPAKVKGEVARSLLGQLRDPRPGGLAQSLRDMVDERFQRAAAPLEAGLAQRHPAIERIGARLRSLAEEHDPDGSIRAAFRAEHPDEPCRPKGELPKRGPGKSKRAHR